MPGCGQTLPKFLSIDHVHNDGYKERRGSDMASRPGPGTRIAAVFEDPSRYQVLCCNCNLAKGHGKGGKCPYEGTPH